MSAGGIDSRLTRIPRYVVPQIRADGAPGEVRRADAGELRRRHARASSRLAIGKTRRFLHRFEHDGRARRTHAGYAGEARAQEMPEVLGVARAHLDEVAVVAGDVVDLEYFGQLGQRLGDAILGPGLVAANGHEGEQARGRAPWDRSGRRSPGACRALRACESARAPPTGPGRRPWKSRPASRERWPAGARGSAGRCRRVFCRSAQYSQLWLNLLPITNQCSVGLLYLQLIVLSWTRAPTGPGNP